MSSLILVAALAFGQPGPDLGLGPQQIALQRRAPLALFLITPSGEGGATRSSELIRRIGDLVERHTDLYLRPLDVSEIAECAGRLACMAKKARPDYSRSKYELDNGTVAPYADHLADLRRRKVEYPQYLLVVSNITGEALDRLSVTLLDTDAALAATHARDPRAEGAAAQLEVQIRRDAVLGTPQWGEIANPDEAEAFLSKVFDNHLRRRLEDAGHWEPFGTIEITAEVPGAVIRLDGEAVGATQSNLTRITAVRAGRHELELTHPERITYQTTVEVVRRETVRLQASLPAASSDVARIMRQSMLWSGLGLVASGAVITTVAVTRQDGAVTTICPTFDGETGCGGSRFITSGYNPGASPTFDDEVNPGGVLLAPLGYSLAATGAVWSLTTLLFGSDREIPWWQLVGGLAAGGLAYGISHALNPSSPYEAP